VRELSPKELAELAAFIAEQDNAAWDKQIDEDSASGKLDFLLIASGQPASFVIGRRISEIKVHAPILATA
jgi:hypothetical protein